MSCHSDYITLNRDNPSRSGQYASDLPGVEDEVLELISKGSESLGGVWDRVYRNAWTNMISDVQAYLQSKFFVNQKLVSRETSEFRSDINTNSGLAGVRIQFDLPRYAKIHVVSIEVIAQAGAASPGASVQFYEDDENGELLHETDQQIGAGRQTIFVDRDFEVDKLFVAFDPAIFQFQETQNKYYNTGVPQWSIWECTFPCFSGQASIRQINGGGLNVIFDIYCSTEKFVCQNLNLFAKTLWWKIGQEIVIERRYGNRLNQYTTMTQERAEELTSFYQAQYTQSLENSLASHNIYEDPICFECMGTVSTKTILP